MGEEDAGKYNERVDAAFEARRIKAWPYDGGVVVKEYSRRGSRQEVFLIDNWCLVGSIKAANGVFERSALAQHRFDYDSYKILYGYLTNPINGKAITTLKAREFQELLRNGSRETLTVRPSSSKS